MEHVLYIGKKNRGFEPGRRVVYSTMNWSGIFDKISQTYFGTSPPAELSLAIGLKKCWSYVAFLQAMENFTLSLNASISDLYFGIKLMHYYWVKSFTLVLLTWVMVITELFATVHLALSSSIYYTFKTQWYLLCYVAVHYIILKAPSEKAQLLHQQQHQKWCFFIYILYWYYLSLLLILHYIFYHYY